MYSRPAAPRSIGGVLDDAIRLYRASFSRCWPLSLAGAVLVGITSLYGTMQMNSLQLGNITGGSYTSSANMAAMAATIARLQRMEHTPMLWLSYVLIMAAWLVFRAAIIRRQEAVATDREDTLGEALGFALGHLPQIVLAGIVFAVAIAVGFMLFIIPGFWLWGSLELWLVSLCAENLGPMAALGRSWRLIEHHWWRTSTILFVAFVIIIVLSLMEGLLVGLFSVMLRSDLGLVLALSQALGALLSVFTTPMLTAVMVAVFYDLKLRREGGDLAARVSSL